MPAQLLLALPESSEAEPLVSLLEAWRDADIEVETLHFDSESSGEAIESKLKEAMAGRHVIIGSFSRGARIAAALAEGSTARALLCLAYPFHKHGHPGDRHGLQHLLGLTLPTLIVQGSRDAHGNREEVRGYANLPACLRLHWIEDGNHRWQPRARSGQDAGKLVQEAARIIGDFVSTPQ